jgi:hypothetical protein
MSEFPVSFLAGEFLVRGTFLIFGGSLYHPSEASKLLKF